MELDGIAKAIHETGARYIRARTLAAHVRLQDLKAAFEPVLAEILAMQALAGLPADAVYPLPVDALAIRAAKLRIAAELQGADSSAFHAPAPGTLVN